MGVGFRAGAFFRVPIHRCLNDGQRVLSTDERTVDLRQSFAREPTTVTPALRLKVFARSAHAKGLAFVRTL